MAPVVHMTTSKRGEDEPMEVLLCCTILADMRNHSHRIDAVATSDTQRQDMMSCRLHWPNLHGR